jgi:hypothetical protein
MGQARGKGFLVIHFPSCQDAKISPKLSGTSKVNIPGRNIAF